MQFGRVVPVGATICWLFVAPGALEVPNERVGEQPADVDLACELRRSQLLESLAGEPEARSLTGSRPSCLTMHLRDYRTTDFDPMWTLDQECFPPGISYSRSELRAFVSRKATETIVAELEGHVAAFVLGWRHSRTDGHVITLDVAASARRQGLGRSLLRELERRFLSAGVRRVQLETAVTNMTAIAFYERLGYRKVAHLLGYYGQGHHAWKMEKALDERVGDTGFAP